jgi:hypothetical protein
LSRNVRELLAKHEEHLVKAELEWVDWGQIRMLIQPSSHTYETAVQMSGHMSIQ